jgi:DNA-binding protein HU-beta
MGDTEYIDTLVDTLIALRRLAGCERNIDTLIATYYQDSTSRTQACLRKQWPFARNQLRQLLREHVHDDLFVESRMKPIVGVASADLNLTDSSDVYTSSSSDTMSVVSDMSYIDMDFATIDMFDADTASEWSSDSDTMSGSDSELDGSGSDSELDIDAAVAIGVSLKELKAKASAKLEARKKSQIDKAIVKAKQAGSADADAIRTADEAGLIAAFKKAYADQRNGTANLVLVRKLFKLNNYKKKLLKNAEKNLKKAAKATKKEKFVSAALIGAEGDDANVTLTNAKAFEDLKADLLKIPDEKIVKKQTKAVEKLIAKQVKKMNKLEKKRAKQQAKVDKVASQAEAAEAASDKAKEAVDDATSALTEADAEVAAVSGRPKTRGNKKAREAEKEQNSKDLKAAKKAVKKAKKALKKANKTLKKPAKALAKARKLQVKYQATVDKMDKLVDAQREKSNVAIEKRVAKSNVAIEKRVAKIMDKIRKQARGALITNLRTMIDILADQVDKQISKGTLKKVFKTKGNQEVLNERIEKLSAILKALQDIVTEHMGSATKNAFNAFAAGGGKGKKFRKATTKADKNRALLEGTDAVPGALSETLDELPKDKAKTSK